MDYSPFRGGNRDPSLCCPSSPQPSPIGSRNIIHMAPRHRKIPPSVLRILAVMILTGKRNTEDKACPRSEGRPLVAGDLGGVSLCFGSAVITTTEFRGLQRRCTDRKLSDKLCISGRSQSHPCAMAASLSRRVIVVQGLVLRRIVSPGSTNESRLVQMLQQGSQSQLEARLREFASSFNDELLENQNSCRCRGGGNTVH